MTDEQKIQIGKLREQGLSYSAVADKLELSLNTIKSYCKHHGYGGVMVQKQKSDEPFFCLNCGVEVEQNPGRKRKKFCCDKCRNKWWNSHLDQVKKKANYECTCQYCGTKYISYGNKGRKYCSHDCYISDRFGGVQ